MAAVFERGFVKASVHHNFSISHLK